MGGAVAVMDVEEFTVTPVAGTIRLAVGVIATKSTIVLVTKPVPVTFSWKLPVTGPDVEPPLLVTTDVTVGSEVDSDELLIVIP
jgi:hypothetical protein